MKILQFVEQIGAGTLEVIEGLGRFAQFTATVLMCSGNLFKKPMLLIRAMYQAGVLSLPIILVAGFFVGMVLAFQGYTTLVNFGAEQSLGIMVALSLMRELGSVVSALLFAGRAGSSITAEIGLMKTTEQLSAMEMMAIDPVAHVAVPRFWGALLVLPLLVTMFVGVAIVGAYMVGVLHLGVDGGVFWSQMQSGVDFYDDIIEGMVIKGLIFGLLTAAISVYQGFSCPPTARGMGAATTKTVVLASLAVLGMDFILTAMMFGG